MYVYNSLRLSHLHSIVRQPHIFTYDGIRIVLGQVGGDCDQQVIVAMVIELKAPNLDS